jgi:hypothetical protein
MEAGSSEHSGREREANTFARIELKIAIEE